MKTIDKLKRCTSILFVLGKRYIQLSDIEKRIQIEESKPPIESYSVVSRRWLMARMEIVKSDIYWLQNRYHQTIKECNDILI